VTLQFVEDNANTGLLADFRAHDNATNQDVDTRFVHKRVSNVQPTAPNFQPCMLSQSEPALSAHDVAKITITAMSKKLLAEHCRPEQP